jgi:competence protein ComFC
MHGMRKIWELFLEFIFPVTEHGKTLISIDPLTIRTYYRPQTHNTTISLAKYREPVIHAAVASCKFEHNDQAAKLLAVLVEQWLQTRTEKAIIMVPIPLHPRRERERGFNQVTRVLQQITDPRVSIIPTILIRKRNTERQTSLHKEQRQKNILGAFVVQASAVEAIHPTTELIVLCDDVLTTGATMNAARATLAPHLSLHTKLICITWAH